MNAFIISCHYLSHCQLNLRRAGVSIQFNRLWFHSFIGSLLPRLNCTTTPRQKEIISGPMQKANVWSPTVRSDADPRLNPHHRLAGPRVNAPWHQASVNRGRQLLFTHQAGKRGSVPSQVFTGVSVPGVTAIHLGYPLFYLDVSGSQGARPETTHYCLWQDSWGPRDGQIHISTPSLTAAVSHSFRHTWLLGHVSLSLSRSLSLSDASTHAFTRVKDGIPHTLRQTCGSAVHRDQEVDWNVFIDLSERQAENSCTFSTSADCGGGDVVPLDCCTVEAQSILHRQHVQHTRLFILR